MSGQGRPKLATVEANDLALAIAATRWHAEITDSLVERAAAAAKACGVTDVAVVRVAGAIELPVVARFRRDPDTAARGGHPAEPALPHHQA